MPYSFPLFGVIRHGGTAGFCVCSTVGAVGIGPYLSRQGVSPTCLLLGYLKKKKKECRPRRRRETHAHTRGFSALSRAAEEESRENWQYLFSMISHYFSRVRIP